MFNIKNTIRNIAFVFLVAFTACSTPPNEKKCDFDIYSNIEFEMDKVVVPEFADYKVSIEKYNAVSGGQTINTKAINQTITDVAENGGGTVIIPSGIWLTGPIVLKSNVNLHLMNGALLVFSTDKNLYPLVETSFEGLNTIRCQSPIYGKNLENIAITGKGVIDGSGGAWRFVKKSKLTESQWKKLVKSGGIVDEEEKSWYPSESFMLGMKNSDMNVPEKFENIEDYLPMKDFLRPVMISLVSCKNVLLDGPVFQNSPAWNIHPLMCANLTVRNVTVRNPWYSQNGDGIDIESCKNTVLYNSTFDVGDDAICIKSGKNKDGRDRGIANENLIVKNCIVYHGHGGVTVGSEMSGGVKNLHVSGCTFIGTDVGLRFKSTRGRGGVVENIYISDINMTDIPTNAISFNMYYGGLSVSEMLAQKDNNNQTADIPEVTEETPVFRNIEIRDVECKGAKTAIYLQGLPEINLANVTLENINIEAKNGLICVDADGVKISNMNLITKKKPIYSFINVKNIEANNLNINNNSDKAIQIQGNKSQNIKIEVNSPDVIEIGNEVNKENIEILSSK